MQRISFAFNSVPVTVIRDSTEFVAQRVTATNRLWSRPQGNPRYRPSPWLSCRAQLGMSLTLHEATESPKSH
jgi:hypothetical protein